MNVFSYWEGPRPAYIDVCLKSIRKACGNDFVLVEPETVDVWLNGHLNRNYLLLNQPALRADAIRAALMAVHGGWWLDADTICFRHPEIINEMFSEHVLYMTWDNPPRRILNGYIYMERDCQAARRWLERVNTALDGDPSRIDWTDLGEKSLTADLTGADGAREIPRRLFLPIDIDCNVKEFFSDRNPRPLIEPSTICFGLNHSWFMYHKRSEMTIPRDQWAESRLLIHRLLAGAN